MRFKWLAAFVYEEIGGSGEDVTWWLINPSSAEFIACQDSDSGWLICELLECKLQPKSNREMA